jgi:transcription initiation factor TFIIE subunit alpha
MGKAKKASRAKVRKISKRAADAALKKALSGPKRAETKKAKAEMRLKDSKKKMNPRPVASKTNQKTNQKPNQKFNAKSVIRKKNDLRVLNITKTITEDQKKELVHLHTILTDPFIRQMLIEIGGESALEIVRNFYGNHSDEELSKSLELRISDVRATLNRLHNEGLVKYVREKDSETGWYSYSWSLNRERIMKWADSHLKIGIGAHGKEGKEYYFCPTCGVNSMVEFAPASDLNFRCGKCEKSLEFVDAQKMVELNTPQLKK